MVPDFLQNGGEFNDGEGEGGVRRTKKNNVNILNNPAIPFPEM